MCGFAGLLQHPGATRQGLESIAASMAATLVHRGPDDAGAWADADGGLGLAFRRLSIIDLTPLGHQPMISHDGRHAIVFNGEIYNFKALRTELEERGRGFRSNSDTEVILEGVGEWGVPLTVSKLWGMFAIALWDRRDRVLWLVRDRLGKKPLYFARQEGRPLLFGSELKALRAHPSFRADVDRDALASFVRFGYVPAPQAIYRGVTKLEPGCLARVRAGEEPQIERYWDPRAIVRRGLESPLVLDDREATDELEARLGDAVERRLVADVPLGAFLSGGIDSSTVVALMQARSGRTARTFTIGFEQAAFDEAQSAREVARHLGTAHTELYVTPAEARDVIPRLPDLYDEPFADASQIPTFLVARLARRSVTVALSGDGGDELLGGYTRYLWAHRVWRACAPWPAVLRRAAGSALGSVPPGVIDGLYSHGQRVLPSRLRQSHSSEKAQKLAAILGAGSADDVYRRLVAQWPDAGRVVPGGRAGATAADDESARGEIPGMVDRMMYFDLVGYLPGDILTKVDRASMGVSLEARGPLLDHRLVEWAWQLPFRFKFRDGVGKWLLRQVLYRHVPREIVERPKTGFGVPVGEWLRGPLREWAEALLDEARMRREGYLDPGPVRARWAEHLSGRRDHQQPLWVVLMFQAWLDRWRA